MYLLAVLCLVTVAVALPVIPEPPSLPAREYVEFDSSVLFKNAPIIEFVHEEKKDDNAAEQPREIVLSFIPPAPVLGSLDESILRKIVYINEDKKSEDSKASKSEVPENEGAIKEGEEAVKIEVINVEAAQPNLVKLTIPSPPSLNTIITSINQFLPIPLPNINWPNFPSFFKPPVITILHSEKNL